MVNDAALWISAMAIMFFGAVPVFLFLLLVYKVCAEWRVAIKDRRRLHKEGCYRIGETV